MLRQPGQQGFLSLEVATWICGKEAEGMRAEEVMGGFEVNLAGDGEQC